MTLPKNTKFGSLLVSQNLITNEQRLEILEMQKTCAKPFGLLAENLFNVHPRDTQRVWLMQYMSVATRINLCSYHVDTRYLSLMSKRQAWQFKLMPVAFTQGCLLLATTEQNLARAHRFATKHIDLPFIFVIAKDQTDLELGLEKSYPGKAMRYQHHLKSVDSDATQTSAADPSAPSHKHQLVG